MKNKLIYNNMSLTYQTNYSKYIEKLYGTKRDIFTVVSLIS